MALYEANFIRLSSIIRDLQALDGERVSRTLHDLDLHLSVVCVARFTLDLRLTYLFDGPAGGEAEPDLQLRLYLDARMVEVTGRPAMSRHPFLASMAQRWRRPLDRRWAENLMLGKWLDYLAEKGHAFG